MDVVWGDAELLIAVAPEARGRGVGSFILEKVENEARRMGVNHVCNQVRPTHPDREAVSAWFRKRGFQPNEDGTLLRAVVPKEAAP